MAEKKQHALPERASQQIQQKQKVRVFKKRWLETASQQGKAPLATEKCLAQLERMIGRMKVHSRRGRTMLDLPPLRVSLLEKQALEECIELIHLKLRMQRGEVLSRNRER